MPSVLSFAALTLCLCVGMDAAAQAPTAPTSPTADSATSDSRALPSFPSTPMEPRPWLSETELAKQEEAERARNAFYVELGGAALLYSLNLEHRFHAWFAFRVGLSLFPGSSAELYVALPLTLSYVGLRWFELGVGATPFHIAGRDDTDSWSNTQLLGMTFAGFRLDPARGEFHFRIGAMLILGSGAAFKGDDDGPPPELYLFPFGYLSLGTAF